MNWTLTRARRQLSELVRASAEEPQYVLSRGRVVAAVVSAEELSASNTWRDAKAETLGEAMGRWREVCVEEKWTLQVAERSDRDHPPR